MGQGLRAQGSGRGLDSLVGLGSGLGSGAPSEGRRTASSQKSSCAGLRWKMSEASVLALFFSASCSGVNFVHSRSRSWPG